VPMVVAPRGQLSPGAMSIRRWKKLAFLSIARTLGLYRDAIWQASTEHEAAEIRHHFDRDPVRPIRVTVAPDLASLDLQPPPSTRKRAGELHAVWLSRITRKKNLHGAIEILARVGHSAQLDVYGTIDDKAYWDECRKRIEALPRDVRVTYRGVVPYPDVIPTLARYDLFLFPSLGENFGHVILEALAAGCPVLTSDQTAFRDLTAAGVGWTLPVRDLEAFRARLRECIAMDDVERDRIAQQAVDLARRYVRDERSIEANRALFREAAERARRRSQLNAVGFQPRDQNIA
jgi:glycosyltransferase involved in cell wall biosynthesis